jgi:hypothetical protein
MPRFASFPEMFVQLLKRVSHGSEYSSDGHKLFVPYTDLLSHHEEMGAMPSILLVLAVVGALIVLTGINVDPQARAPAQITAHEE